MTVLGNGQVGIGTDAPEASAILQIDSTTLGVMGTRWTSTQETTNLVGLGSTDAGLQWFNTTTSQFRGWNGTAAVTLG